MDESMSNEMIVGVVLMTIQFGIFVIIGLISYIFKASIDNIRETFGAAIDNILFTIKEIKEDRAAEARTREKNDDEMFKRIRDIENDVAILKSKEGK